MNPRADTAADWLAALRRYLAASLILHFTWEVLQLPLYTISSEPITKQAFAILHCTVGDLMIAGLSLLIALARADCIARDANPRVFRQLRLKMGRSCPVARPF